MRAVPTIESHIDSLKLRPLDQAEGFLSSGKPPKESLKDSVNDSIWAYSIVGNHDDIPLGIFGLARYEGYPLVGCPWFVCSEAMFKDKQDTIQFLREGKKYVQKMHQAFPILTNMVDIHNTQAHRWLKWLGFEFHRTIPYGPFNHPFIQFIRCVT